MTNQLYQTFHHLLSDFNLAQIKTLYALYDSTGNLTGNEKEEDLLAKLWDKVRTGDFNRFTKFEQRMKADFANVFPAQDLDALKQALASQNGWPQSYDADESRFYLHLDRDVLKRNFFALLKAHQLATHPYIFLLKGALEDEPVLAVETAMDFYKNKTNVQPKRLPETQRPLEKFNLKTKQAEEAWREGMNFLLDISWDEEPDMLEDYSEILANKHGKEVVYAYQLIEAWDAGKFQEYLSLWKNIERAEKQRFFVFLKFLDASQELWDNEIPHAIKKAGYPVIKQFSELEKITKKHFDDFLEDPNIQVCYSYKSEVKKLPPLYMQEALEKLEYKGTL